MKKLLLALLISTSFLACKKDKQKCYECTNSWDRSKTIECGDTMPRRDANGNDLNCILMP